MNPSCARSSARQGIDQLGVVGPKPKRHIQVQLKNQPSPARLLGPHGPLSYSGARTFFFCPETFLLAQSSGTPPSPQRSRKLENVPEPAPRRPAPRRRRRRGGSGGPRRQSRLGHGRQRICLHAAPPSPLRGLHGAPLPQPPPRAVARFGSSTPDMLAWASFRLSTTYEQAVSLARDCR
jgi:hypothetical protein